MTPGSPGAHQGPRPPNLYKRLTEPTGSCQGLRRQAGTGQGGSRAQALPVRKQLPSWASRPWAQERGLVFKSKAPTAPGFSQGAPGWVRIAETLGIAAEVGVLSTTSLRAHPWHTLPVGGPEEAVRPPPPVASAPAAWGQARAYPRAP